MRRAKVHAPAQHAQVAPAVAGIATQVPARRAVVQRAAAPGAAKPAVKPPAPRLQSEVNHSADHVAAALSPLGQVTLADELEIVKPGGIFIAPAGMQLRGFLHRDGTAVKFAGVAGPMVLGQREAESEFGRLIRKAQDVLAAYPVPVRAAKPAAKPTPVQRSADVTAAPAQAPADAVQTALSRSAGQPLPVSTRPRLEASYGVDLGQVRVHTDSASDQAARAVQSRAFTTGQDIFFRSGQYSPGTSEGRKLIAHEVAHTVQQGSGTGELSRQVDPSELHISEPGDSLEREADVAAAHALSGRPASLAPRSGAVLARLADGPPVPAASVIKPAPAPAGKQPAAPAPAPAAGGKQPAAAPGAPPAGAVPAGKSPEAPGQAAPPTAPPAKAKKSAEKQPAAEKSTEGDGLASVLAGVTAAGQEQKQHDPAEQKATEAKAAVGVSAENAQGEGKRQQVEAMAGQKPKPFDRATFVKRLQEKIASLQSADAKGIKDGDKVQGVNDAVKGEVAAGKQSAAGGIQQAAQQTPTPGAAVPGTELPQAKPGAAAKVDGSKAVPPPMPDERVSMAGQSKAIDEQMAGAGVTQEQLQKANEPQFSAAADARTTAQTQADALPAQARADEQQALQKGQKEAATATQTGLAEMHGKRAELLVGGRDVQTAGTGKHDEVKKRLATQFDAIYGRTKTAVDDRLAKLDKEVAGIFDEGASAAKLEFYVFLGAELLVYYAAGGWLVDAFTEGKDREKIFDRGKQRYLDSMGVVIGRVADAVESALNEVVDLIAKGKAELDAEVAKLPAEEQAVGREVAQGVQEKFSELEKSVEEKQQQIIDSVAEKYVAAQKEVDSVLATLKDPVGAAIQYVKETVAGVIETLAKMRELLMNVLAKAGEAIDLILADPIGFVGNLAAGVKQGLMNFVANIGTHLQKGLFAWLFGALAEAGIQIPDKFDLSGILSVVLQVLGLTWPNIRKRAVAIVGEKVVSALETASEIIVTLVTKGPAGLWEYIKEQASALLDSVIEGIKSFLIEKVIMAGVTWVIGLLNPASAFVKACKAIYDIIMFFVERGQQILELVNAVLDSVLAVAKGNTAVAAAAVENALAKAVPVAIGFLAGLLGLGGLGEKIKAVIEKIQKPINAAIDWVIKKAVELVKAVGKMLGFGKEEKEKKSTEDGALSYPFTMHKGSHTLYVVPVGDDVKIEMASNERDLVATKVEAFLNSPAAKGIEPADLAELESSLKAISKVRSRWKAPRIEGQTDKQRTEAVALVAEYRLIISKLEAIGAKYQISDLLGVKWPPMKRFLPAGFKPRERLYYGLGKPSEAMDQCATEQRAVIISNAQAAIGPPANPSAWKALQNSGKLPTNLNLNQFKTAEAFSGAHVIRGTADDQYQVHHEPPLFEHWNSSGGNNTNDDARTAAARGKESVELNFVTVEWHKDRHRGDGDEKYRNYVGPEFTSELAEGGSPTARKIGDEAFKTEEQ